MGRTVSPYSRQIEAVKDRYAKFRKGLRKSDQHHFDDMFISAKLHVQSGVMQAAVNPAETVLLSILLEQQKTIAEMQRQIKRLDARLTKS